MFWQHGICWWHARGFPAFKMDAVTSTSCHSYTCIVPSYMVSGLVCVTNKYSQSDSVGLLRFWPSMTLCCVCFPSLDYSAGNQLPCREDISAAWEWPMWGGWGIPPTARISLAAMWMTHLGSRYSSPWSGLQMTSASANILPVTSCVTWARTTLPKHSGIPDPRRLWV